MKIYEDINDEILKEICDVLDNNGLIIFPTDTVYGIACNSMSDEAITKLYEVKGRSFNKPIGILTDSISKILLVVRDITPKEKQLMNKYFPGNLTIILNKKSGISDILTAGKSTIGVRIPNNEIALKILKSYPYPLATTSANMSSFKDGSQLEDFVDDFKNKVDIIIDGGKTHEAPSTIVRIEDDKIEILRQGDLKIDD